MIECEVQITQNLNSRELKKADMREAFRKTLAIVLSDVLETTLSVINSANVSLAFFELLWVRWYFFIGRLPKVIFRYNSEL